MSDFQKLLAELNEAAEEQSTLAKSLSADDGEEGDDDDKIDAAASEGAEGEGGDADGEGEADEGEPDDGEGDGEGEGESTLSKSMTIGDQEVELVDAEQLIKSLSDLTGRMTNHETLLAKALETTLSTIKSQGEMIKSLSADLKKLSGQGRGRKTILSVHERQTAGQQMAKSHGDDQSVQLKPKEFMAKALTAQKAGKLTGVEVARLEQYQQSGLPYPEDILSRIGD